MAVETLTKNYGWTKPVIDGSPETWGGFLNNDLDSIDALVFANQQGLVPIGTITMFAGATAPPNFLMCDGTSYSTAPPYDKLYGVIGSAFGSSGAGYYNVPNIQQRFPLGAGPNPLGQVGGGFSYSLTLANIPAHNHSAWQDAHAHSVWQAAHTHYIYQDVHSHGVYQDAHNHGDYGHGHPASAGDSGQHSHGSNLMRFVGQGASYGIGVAPGNVSIGNTDGASAPGVSISIGTGYANLAAAQPAVHADNQQPGVHCDTQTPAVAMSAAQPNVYTANTGSGSAFSVVPPYVAINFIIRYQ